MVNSYFFPIFWGCKFLFSYFFLPFLLLDTWDIKKLCKPRKADKAHSQMFQYNGLAQAKTVETMSQNSTLTQPTAVALPIQQVATTGTYTQPITISATVPTQPVVTIAGQPQQFPTFCALCTPIGRQCLNNCLLPIHPEWSDSEEEKKGLKEQEEKEEQEEEVWDGTIQKQKDEKE